MSNYNNLKTSIDANIKQNGNQEITGPILNSILNQMVNILGTGYQFAGVATLDPATDPGTPDAKVFYIANGKGTYTNFGGLEVTEDEVVVLYYDTTWHKVATGIASQAKLSELKANDAEQERTINGLKDQVNNYKPIEITGNVTNAADEEDLTSENGLLKIKNRSSLNGMGYVILRKDKTFAEQVTQANTIYEIRYDFSLGGAEMHIPSNCNLFFNGGKLANATLVGSNTKMYGNLIHIFENITIGGTWLIHDIYSSMFVDIEDNHLKDLFAFQNASIQNHIYVEDGIYDVDIPIKGSGASALRIFSNTDVTINGEIHLAEQTNQDELKYGYYMIKIAGDNVNLNGSGILIGDKKLSEKTTEYGHGIITAGTSVKNVTIEGIKIKDTYGDGITISVGSQNINIKNIEITNWHRNGISIVYGSGYISVDGVNIHDGGTTAPMGGIDIEPNENDLCDVFINNTNIESCPYGIVSNAPALGSIGNVIITDLRLSNIGKNYFIKSGLGTCKSLTLKNVQCDNIPQRMDSYGNMFYFAGINRIEMDNVKYDDREVSSSSSSETSIYISTCPNGYKFSECDFKTSSILIYSINTGNAEIINSIIFANNFALSSSSYPIRSISLKGCSLYFVSNFSGEIDDFSVTDCHITINKELYFNSVANKGLTFNNNIVEVESATSLTYVASLSMKSMSEVKHNIFKDNSQNVSEGVRLSNPSDVTISTNFVFEGNYFDSFKASALLVRILGKGIKAIYNAPTYGSSSDRPIMPNQYYDNSVNGFCYFDNTIRKPIYWAGTKWVDANGADV